MIDPILSKAIQIERDNSFLSGDIVKLPPGSTVPVNVNGSIIQVKTIPLSFTNASESDLKKEKEKPLQPLDIVKFPPGTTVPVNVNGSILHVKTLPLMVANLKGEKNNNSMNFENNQSKENNRLFNETAPLSNTIKPINDSLIKEKYYSIDYYNNINNENDKFTEINPILLNTLNPIKNNNILDSNSENITSTITKSKNNNYIQEPIISPQINLLNNKISNLENELNQKDNTIVQLRNEINDKNIKINSLKMELNNKDLLYNDLLNKIKENRNANRNYNNEVQSLQGEIIRLKNEIINMKLKANIIQNNNNCVNFISMDGKIHYAIPCNENEIFAFVEEKLYQQYPEYRENNNSFLANGNTILRFKTIKDNKIGTGFPVTLISPNNEDSIISNQKKTNNNIETRNNINNNQNNIINENELNNDIMINNGNLNRFNNEMVNIGINNYDFNNMNNNNPYL